MGNLKYRLWRIWRRVEHWMIANGLLEASDAAPDAPIDSACTDEQHAAMEQAARSGRIQFVQ